jgi:hypothetical protein
VGLRARGGAGAEWRACGGARAEWRARDGAGAPAGGATPSATPSYKVPRVFWPLIGGFIAFILFAIFMGWVMDTSRHGGGKDGADGAGHGGH